MRWFIVDKTEKRGPFTSQEIRSKLRSNEATLDTLIVKEGSPLCRKISQVPEILNLRPNEQSGESEFEQNSPQKTTISQLDLKPPPLKSAQSKSPPQRKETNQEDVQRPKKIAAPLSRVDYDNNLNNTFDLSEVEHQPTRQVQLANPYAAGGGFGSRSQEQFASSGANREPLVQKNYNSPPEVVMAQPPPAYVGTPIASQAMIPSLGKAFFQQNSPVYENERPAQAYQNEIPRGAPEAPRGMPAQNQAPPHAVRAMPPHQPPQYSDQGFKPQASIAMDAGQGAPQAQMNAQPLPQYAGIGGAAAAGPGPMNPANDNRRGTEREKTRGPRELRDGRATQKPSSSLGTYLIVIVAGITMGLTLLIGFFASRKNSKPIPVLQALGIQQNSNLANQGISKNTQVPIQQEDFSQRQPPAQVIRPPVQEPPVDEMTPEKTYKNTEKRKSNPPETRRSERSSRPQPQRSVALAARREVEQAPEVSSPLPSSWPDGAVTSLKQLKLKIFKVVSVDGIQISSVPRNCEPCKLEGTLNGGGKVFLVSASPEPWNGVSDSSQKIAVKGFVRRDEKGRFSIIVQSVVDR